MNYFIKTIIICLFAFIVGIDSVSASKKIAILVTSTGSTGGVGTQGYTQACRDRFMQAFEGFEVTFFEAGNTTPSKTELLEQFGEFDLIVVHPTVPGTNAHLIGLKALVGEIPFLNLKSFSYNSGRWDWATAQNTNDVNVNYLTVADKLQNHPIFMGVSFGAPMGTSLRLYTGTTLPAANAMSKVNPLPFSGSGWQTSWNTSNHLLASHHCSRTETTNMHEILVDNAAKYILLSISTENGAFTTLNDDAILLLKNAVEYLTNPLQYYDYQNNVVVGGDWPVDDASLRRLSVSVGELTPSFNIKVTDYTLPSKPSSVSSITFTTMPNVPNVTITGDGVQPLVVGENVFPIVVTALDGTTQMTYTVTITIIQVIPVSNIDVSGIDEMEVTETIVLTPTIYPEFVIDRTLEWTSLDPTIASVWVDTDGRAFVTGLKAGEVVIRVFSVANPEVYTDKTITVHPSSRPERQMERLDRGFIAVRGAGAGGNNIFFSWRLYATDPVGVTFNIYRNDETTPINPTPLGAANTNYTLTNGLTNGTTTAQFVVATIVNGVEIERSKKVRVWTTRDGSNNPYLSIPVEKPPPGRVWNGTGFQTYTDYHIGSATVADLDGDGEYEIIFFWLPDNLQDNANEGYTGNVYIDAYKLDGTKMWGPGKFINLGNNIRAGAHYNMFLVYDFDGDGKAEIIVKTADGTSDTQGNFVGNPAFDDGRYIQNTSSRRGRILQGDEYLSVFDGATGRLLDTKPYVVGRENISGWGNNENYGNRVDRFLACVAYLDAARPSAVMCRGYYGRTTLTAWDWDGKSLQTKWIFDSSTLPANIRSQWEGQGNHQLSVLPAGEGGRDVIIYGAMTVNYDGTGLYSTRFNHGDAMHAGKLDPTRPGLQVMSVRETPNPWGLQWHDAATGELIYGVSVPPGTDVGRGMCADIDPLYPGNESWGTSAIDGTYSAKGERIGNRISGANMTIWWDGDTGRELMDGGNGNNPGITKITASGPLGNRSFSSSNIATFNGARSHGGTKQNPNLQADILGDWREEAIYRSADNSELRIYTTTIPTVHTGAGAVPMNGIPTLMHDHTYRMAIVWQNVAYNQPPHTGFFLGYNMENAPRLQGGVINVTFDPNGGKFDDDTTEEKQISTITGAYFVLPDVTNFGHVLEGWFLSNGEKYDPNAFYKENIILSAVWRELFFDVTVTNGTGDGTYKAGEVITITANQPAEGELFKEWIVTNNAVINILPNTKSNIVTFLMPEEDVEVMATFETIPVEPTLYTVTFNTNSNGAVATPTPITDIVEGTKVGTLPTLAKWDDKIFDGWNTQADGKGAVWTSETIVTADITLYAVWKEDTTNETDLLIFANLNVYPNPTNDVVTIIGLEAGDLLSIFDTAGRLVLQMKATNKKKELFVGNLPKGLYFVTVARNNTEKVIKLVVN